MRSLGAMGPERGREPARDSHSSRLLENTPAIAGSQQRACRHGSRIWIRCRCHLSPVEARVSVNNNLTTSGLTARGPCHSRPAAAVSLLLLHEYTNLPPGILPFTRATKLLTVGNYFTAPRGKNVVNLDDPRSILRPTTCAGQDEHHLQPFPSPAGRNPLELFRLQRDSSPEAILGGESYHADQSSQASLGCSPRPAQAHGSHGPQCSHSRRPNALCCTCWQCIGDLRP